MGAPGGPVWPGSRSPLDRVGTKQHEMTFYALGEMVSTDEDTTRVEDGLDALVRGDGGRMPPPSRFGGSACLLRGFG